MHPKTNKGMEINKEKIEEIFNEWNKRAFNNELPTPTFEVMTTKSMLGQYSWKKRNNSVCHKIRISNYYDRTENGFTNTIVHEMLHYYIRFKNIKDTSSHGRIWKQMAKDLNKRFRTLQIQRCSELQGSVSENVLERKRTAKKRIVAIGMGNDGEYYGSIIPEKNFDYFKPIYKNWKFLTNLHFIEHYDDGTTMKLPIVRTRGRVKRITKDEFNDLLKTKESELLSCMR